MLVDLRIWLAWFVSIGLECYVSGKPPLSKLDEFRGGELKTFLQREILLSFAISLLFGEGVLVDMLLCKRCAWKRCFLVKGVLGDVFLFNIQLCCCGEGVLGGDSWRRCLQKVNVCPTFN